jgi:hypothetical protein
MPPAMSDTMSTMLTSDIVFALREKTWGIDLPSAAVPQALGCSSKVLLLGTGFTPICPVDSEGIESFQEIFPRKGTDRPTEQRGLRMRPESCWISYAEGDFGNIGDLR